jgi:hypothetical protein
LEEPTVNQPLATSKKHAAAEHQRDRFDFRSSTAAPRRERHRELFNMRQSRIISRSCPDWFSERIWEDDGGGQLS